MSLPRLPLADWLKVSEASTFPCSFITSLLCLDSTVLTGGATELEKYLSVGTSISGAFLIWSHLLPEDRLQTAKAMARSLMRQGADRDFEETVSKLETPGLFTAEDYSALLGGVVTEVLLAYQSMEYDGVSGDVLNPYRLSALLRVCSRGTKVDIGENGLWRLDSEYADAFNGDPHVLRALHTNRNIVALALWHYLLSVIQPNAFLVMLCEELNRPNEIIGMLKVERGYDTKDLRFAAFLRTLGALCPPIRFVLQHESPTRICSSIGSALLVLDLWLFKRMLEAGTRIVDEACTTHVVRSLPLLAEIGEPLVAAMALGLQAFLTPWGIDVANLLPQCSDSITQDLATLLYAVTLTIGGKSSLKEAQSIVFGLHADSRLPEAVLDAIAAVNPNDLDEEVLSDIAKRFAALSKSATANLVKIQGAVCMNRGPISRLNHLFALMDELHDQGSDNCAYFDQLLAEFCIGVDGAARIVAKALVFENSAMAMCVLRKGGKRLMSSLSTVGLIELRRSFAEVLRSAHVSVALKLELLEVIESLGGQMLDPDILDEIAFSGGFGEVGLHDENGDVKLCAKVIILLMRSDYQLAIGDTVLGKLYAIFDVQGSSVLSREVSCGLLGRLSGIWRRDDYLGEQIATAAVARAIQQSTGVRDRIDILRKVLSSLEEKFFSSNPNSGSNVYEVFLALVAGVAAD